MIIAASKIKAVCTQSEIQLVRASRKPLLERHNAEELKRLAGLARKQFDKWQGLERGQSRQKQRATGASGVDATTKLKAEIFRDALHGFETQLAKVAKTGAADATAAKATRSKTKKVRAAGHRADRAEVRLDISEVRDKMNSERRQKKARAAKAVAPAKVAPAKAAAAKAPVAVKTAAPKATAPKATAPPAAAPKTTVPKGALGIPTAASAAAEKKSRTAPPIKAVLAIPAKQREATTAAKKSRVERSGKTTRMLGHIGSRQKHAQARRDSKG